MRTLLNFLLVAVATTLCVGCGEKEVCEDGSCIRAKIVLKSSNDDCGCFMVVIDDNAGYGSLYKPQNLPEKFQIDGLSVLLSFIELEEKHNCGFGGYVPVIYIEQIKEE